MARTANYLTQSEADAFTKFALENGLVLDGEIGEKNGSALAGFIANKMNADITAETLAAAIKTGDPDWVEMVVGYPAVETVVSSLRNAISIRSVDSRMRREWLIAVRCTGDIP